MTEGQNPPAADAPAADAPAADQGQSLPTDARAQGDKNGPTQQCPYLENEWIADTNGQRNINWAIDNRFNPPACLWWSYQDTPHATVLIRTAETEQGALDMIDAALTHPGTSMDVTISPGDPGATVEATDEPTGWQGYRASKDGSSVYAIRKGMTVVMVHSNQGQTVKPQMIAQQAIESLHL